MNTNHHEQHAPTSRRLARRVAAVLTALAGVAVAPAAASASEGSALACGTVVTASVTLTHDLLGCAGAGLVVGASGITIDLNGHTVAGTGTGAGIDNEAGHDGVTVLDGTVEGFVFGVHLFATRHGHIEDVHVTRNLDGLKIERADRIVIDDVVAAGNGVNGMEITFSRGVVVRDSVATGNGLFGIVDRFSDASRIVGNRAEGNDATGIVVGGTDDAVIRGNTSDANGGHGIDARSDGARVTRNAATGNAGVGILAEGDGIVDGGRNTATDNGEGDCVGVAC